ncbi:efflux RND transporter periplasmic adaptor subunit [Methylocapsa aurea]|uniref:efflux RND transporter periplasmic adaptor subunit n=1 Tax=Methylocapsa aurea TaxID=663610 RepID=UPI00056D8981|nr:efflux RND transporter periplasmic adaptor subunit [Methylocapsa aurea]
MDSFETVLLAAAVIVAVGVGAAAAGERDPRQGPQLVQIAIVKPAEPSERAFTGVVSARVQSNLGFRVPGKVIERLVDIGQNVRAGRPLLRLDQQDLNLALAAKEHAVVAARALAVQATADEARYRQLVAKGYSTRQRYDQAKAAFDSANAQLAAAEAQAEVARNEAGYSLLLADADGTIVETLAEPGQVVAAGQTVVRLAHAGPREAAVNLPEAVRPAIGSAAQAKIYGASSAASPARLRQLSDAADPSSRTYEARYVLEGEASRAPLGATVTVGVATTGAIDASEVPLGALYDDGKSTGVWVVDPASSSVAFRPVLVRRLAEETAVASGVRAGERVVALGAHLLHQGERVRIANDRMAAQ